MDFFNLKLPEVDSNNIGGMDEIVRAGRTAHRLKISGFILTVIMVVLMVISIMQQNQINDQTTTIETLQIQVDEQYWIIDDLQYQIDKQNRLIDDLQKQVEAFN